MREIAALWPGIRWRYLEAERRSSASQRNQGVRAASADIVFLFDDDSLMYPDCAAEIMRVYDIDSARSVVGVNATNVAAPPDASPGDHASAPTEFRTAKHYGPVAKWVRRILGADDIFIPYDPSFPAHPLPTAVAALAVDRWPMGVGWGMTFRREICLAEPFEEILINYAAGEDTDMSTAPRGAACTSARGAADCVTWGPRAAGPDLCVGRVQHVEPRHSSWFVQHRPPKVADAASSNARSTRADQRGQGRVLPALDNADRARRPACAVDGGRRLPQVGRRASYLVSPVSGSIIPWGAFQALPKTSISSETSLVNRYLS